MSNIDPVSTYEEDYHQHVFVTEEGQRLATVEFDDIEDEGSGKLFCELSVTCHVGPADDRPAIAFERVNLLNKGAARGWLMNMAGKLGELGGLPWEPMLEHSVNDSITAYRLSSSEGAWMEKREPGSDDPYLLRPFIADTGVTVLYGSHGSNKSMFALRLAIAIATGDGFDGEEPTRSGPVMYVDFEDTVEPHAYRLTAMLKNLGIDPDEASKLIWHERVTKNLKDARRRLRRLIRDEGFVMVIIDSIGLARAADVSGSEATIKLFKMFAQLNTSILALDHMTKEDNKRVSVGKMDYREATPIGSQFTQSSARLAWFINILPQSTAKKKKANLYNTKHNHTPQHPPVGLTINLDWDDRDQLTQAEFTVQGNSFEAMVTNLKAMTKAEELLLWHFRQQRENDNVLPMTQAEMGGSGINGSTLRAIVTTKKAEWWKQMPGTKKYIISDEGMESAMFLDSFYTEESAPPRGANQDEEEG